MRIAVCTERAIDRLCTGNKGRPGQGRPVGLLIAWLVQSADSGTKYEHQLVKKDLARTAHGLDLRQQARAWLHSMPQYSGVFARERDPIAGEDSEPEVVP